MTFSKITGTSLSGSPPFLGLVPLNPVDLDIPRDLCPAIADFFSLPVEVLPPKLLPPQTHHLVRQQYHSTQLLEYLLKENDNEPLRVLGITGVDLYIPIFTFVFGEAQLDGKAAIISTFRPGGGASMIKPSPSVFLERLLKLSVHELGHTFGLPHCRRESCLMSFAANLEKLDLKNLELCEYCQILLDDYLKGISGL
jgi:archaemetzincin